MNYNSKEEINKLRKRYSQLVSSDHPSKEEKDEIVEILNLPSHFAVNGLKTGLLRKHYKSKLQEESSEFYKHKHQYYFLDLVYMRMDKLESAKSLTTKDLKDLKELFKLDVRRTNYNIILRRLAIKYSNRLNVEDQLSLCLRWLNILKYKKSALQIIFSNYDELAKSSQFLRHQIRLLIGNHTFKKERYNTKVICYQLISHFENIKSNDKYTMVEALTKGMNRITERAARKLYWRKFNYIPIKLRNELLAFIIEFKRPPDYYIKSLLSEKFHNITESNIMLIESRLRTNNDL